ncbi:MAG: GAF domain-containing protein [Bacteroidia bacterium]|nr:GAF domain-containing protein [Bacteroidia bacterium]
MSESLTVTGNSREERYRSLLPQITALSEDKAGKWAILGNIMSALKYGMNFFWAGLYLVNNENLVLGPFQGTVACTHIGFGKGVCGLAWKNRKTIIVDDVSRFDGHIACSSETKSEIVVPVFGKDGEVIMVLDIDSEHLFHFGKTDEVYLEKVAKIIEKTATVG